MEKLLKEEMTQIVSQVSFGTITTDEAVETLWNMFLKELWYLHTGIRVTDVPEELISHEEIIEWKKCFKCLK